MISVICPVYNEALYIEKILEFFISSKPEEKELLIIDGMSDDGTREIVESWSHKYPNIHLIDNCEKFVPQALNKGIQKSKSELIIRLDGHSEYEPDYFEKIIETFNSVETDIVGGPMHAVGTTPFHKTLAYLYSTRLSFGNSKFHDINYRGYSDHVYLGSWHKCLFNELGLFDERLKVDHDEEFSYRARSKGKKIYINPEIKSRYYPRNCMKALIKQFFRYGIEKPIVIKNVPSGIKLRHLIPPLFVLYIMSLPWVVKNFILILPMIIYLILIFYYGFNNSLKLKEKLIALAIYPAIHLSYGMGIFAGLFNLIKNQDISR